jgi:hypothetical protein
LKDKEGLDDEDDLEDTKDVEKRRGCGRGGGLRERYGN